MNIIDAISLTFLAVLLLASSLSTGYYMGTEKVCKVYGHTTWDNNKQVCIDRNKQFKQSLEVKHVEL